MIIVTRPPADAVEAIGEPRGRPVSPQLVHQNVLPIPHRLPTHQDRKTGLPGCSDRRGIVMDAALGPAPPGHAVPSGPFSDQSSMVRSMVTLTGSVTVIFPEYTPAEA